MPSTIEKKDDNQVQLTITVTPEDFNRAMNQAFRKNINRFVIPGFRKGKAPLNLVVKYYGEGVLYEDAIEFAATPAYQEAVKEHGIEPVSRPEMDVLDIGKEKGLVFTILTTVKPEVRLGEYRGIEAVKPEYPVDDAAVEAEIKRVQERNSRLVPVEDRPAADGDTANIDYEGSIDGVAFDGGSGTGYDLRLGSKSFIPGFEDQVIGHRPDDEFDLDVRFPDDYGNADLQGKEARFHVKVNAVKTRELPVLDDEFAKDVSEFDTLDEYRESIRTRLTEQSAKRTADVFEENVVAAVVDQTEIDLPHVMIHDEQDRMIDEQRRQMKYQGIELEQYLSYLGQTLDQYTETLHEPAERRIRTQLVLEAVAKAESVTVDEAEIDAEIIRMSEQYRMDADDLRKRAAEDDHFIRDGLISKKTVALLVEQATPKAAPIEDIGLPGDVDETGDAEDAGDVEGTGDIEETGNVEDAGNVGDAGLSEGDRAE